MIRFSVRNGDTTDTRDIGSTAASQLFLSQKKLSQKWDPSIKQREYYYTGNMLD